MAEQDTVSLEWIGPPGHHSPLFGELRRNKRYPVPPDLAAYLVTHDKDFWARPATGQPRATAKKSTDDKE